MTHKNAVIDVFLPSKASSNALKKMNIQCTQIREHTLSRRQVCLSHYHLFHYQGWSEPRKTTGGQPQWTMWTAVTFTMTCFWIQHPSSRLCSNDNHCMHHLPAHPSIHPPHLVPLTVAGMGCVQSLLPGMWRHTKIPSTRLREGYREEFIKIISLLCDITQKVPDMRLGKFAFV